METIPVIILTVSVALATVVAGFVLGVTYRKKVAEAKIGSAETQAETIVEDAKKLAESRKKEILLEAKEDSIRVKNEFEKELK